MRLCNYTLRLVSCDTESNLCWDNHLIVYHIIHLLYILGVQLLMPLHCLLHLSTPWYLIPRPTPGLIHHEWTEVDIQGRGDIQIYMYTLSF